MGLEDGLPWPCVVTCDELHTVALSLIDNQITVLSAEKMHMVAAAIRFALDVECE